MISSCIYLIKNNLINLIKKYLIKNINIVKKKKILKKYFPKFWMVELKKITWYIVPPSIY